ncbi:MAG: transposase [Weeksellaceae bacterium]|nr:transposase [Bacteroidota bacterium]MCG2780637.1 transposase [Weeksellaceae bacterium]
MKNYDLFIGIDVSKLKLDITGIDQDNAIRLKHCVIRNEAKEIKKHFRKLFKNQSKPMIVGFENTGVYSALIAFVLQELGIDYCQLPSLEISRSRGISRGKNDKIDALKIAQYLLSHRFKISLSTVTEIHLTEMRLLYTHREKIIKSISQYEKEFENTDFLPREIQKEILKSTNSILKSLHANLKKIEDRLGVILKEHAAMEKNFKLITSIPGIGKQTALYLMIVTKNFTAAAGEIYKISD